MNPINIAILSTAHIHTRGFIDNLKKGTDGRRPYAIWDDVKDRGKRYAKECGAKFVSSLGRLLADPEVHGFMICAENTRHLPLLKKALPIGKPVFCEKPMVTTVRDLQIVRDLAAQHHSTLFCGYFQPFSGTMRSIADKLRSGALGKVTHARFRNAHHAAYGHWFDNPDLNWFYQPQLSGGGAFMDMGTHAVHLLRTLLGPVEKVWATISNRSGIYDSVDDFGIAHLQFASGVIGTVEAGWIQTGGLGGLEVVGSDQAVWHDGGNYVIGKPGSPAIKVEPTADVPAGPDRLIAAIQGRIPAADLASDLAACLDAVAIMDAAYKAAKKGSWVNVASAGGSSQASSGR